MRIRPAIPACCLLLGAACTGGADDPGAGEAPWAGSGSGGMGTVPDVPGPDLGGGSSGDGGSGGAAGATAHLCGDGWIDPGEACDDGNSVRADGCELDCTITVGVSAFAVGGAHACALSYTGTVRCWGDASYGQLGEGSTEDVGDVETPYEHGTELWFEGGARSLTAGAFHTCALTVDGDLYCWGRNDRGQLGYGNSEGLGDDPGESPAMAGKVELGGRVIAAQAGGHHTCAVVETGDVRCWGDGIVGQLGIGDGFDGTVGAGHLPYPRPLVGPALDHGPPSVRSLALGVGDHACLVDADRDVVCWGQGSSGQLGHGSIAPIGLLAPPVKYGPVPVGELVDAVAVGARHTCVVVAGGRVRCWGEGTYGQLGYGDKVSIGDDELPVDADVHFDGLAGLAVTAGERFSCALLEDATVRCWGAGDRGQLGDGSTQTVGDDESPADWPGFDGVALGVAVTGIDAGFEHVCARGEDARLRCWGAGDDGRLGTGATADVGADPGDFPLPPVAVFGP